MAEIDKGLPNVKRPEEELLEESNKFDEELKDKSWRKIKTNNCQCDVCKTVRECLNKYKTYEVYEIINH